MLPVMGALVVGYVVALEGGFWKNNYVILHDAHFDVSRVPWGANAVYLRKRTWPIKMSIPYASVTGLRMAENGEVEVDVNTQGLRFEKFGQNITIMFRPKEIMAVVNEMRRRIESAQRS